MPDARTRLRGDPVLTLAPRPGEGVLIVVPTYNERDNVGLLVDAVTSALPGVTLLFVDDASPDGTGAVLDELAALREDVHVLHRAGKLGLGTAYLAGFRWGLTRGYAWLVQMDADFSHDPRHLVTMLDRARAGVDVVVGSRYVAGGRTVNWGVARKLISRGGGLYARGVLGLSVRDPTAGYLCWSRAALLALDLARVRAEGYGFQVEMKYRATRAGLVVEEIPIVFEDRRVGQSKMSRRIFIEALVMVWRLRFER